MNKASVVLGAVVCLALASPEQARSAAVATEDYWLNEGAGLVNFFLPGTGDFDLYDYGLGLELQYRNWYFNPFGWSVSLGIASWEANSGCTDLGRAEHRDFDGTVTLVPVGLSGLFQLYSSETFNLLVEAGVRYVWVDADVDFVRVVQQDKGDPKAIPSRLEIGDGWLGVLAVEADYYVTERFLLFGGLGYQQDIVRGDIETPAGPLRDNELSAFFLRLGGKFVF